MEVNSNIAHLQFERSSCILSFYFEYESKEWELQIELLIKETVGALLQESKRVVQKTIKQNGKAEHNGMPAVGFNASLWREMDVIKESEKLTNLRTMSNIQFHILNVKYNVEMGQPTKKAQLEDVIFSGGKTRPISKSLQNVNTNEYMFWWFKSKDKCSWKEIGNEYSYMVKDTDIGFYLKFQYLCKSAPNAVPGFVISERVVFTFPKIPHCPFELRQINTPDYLKGKKFRFVTYNILSPRHTKDQYNYCPPEYLSSGYRKVVLMKELLGYKADIICLQEVDFNIFRSTLNPEFKYEGFKCVYYHDNKPGKSAIFYNPWKFRKTISGRMTFKSEIIKNKKMKNLLKIIKLNSAIYEVFIHLETSLQFCEFLTRDSNNIVIVVNTHLYYHSKERNVRLLQTAVCLEFLKELCNNRSAHYRRNVSVIFAGDFNSNPRSSVFEFVTRGSIFYNYDYDENMIALLEHLFSFESAYGKPQFTNYTEEFKDCLDYIFYDKLVLLKNLPIPDESVLSKDVALPSAVFPSDHVPLITEFKFR